MVDYITLASLTEFRAWLKGEGLVDEDGKGQLSLPKIPVAYLKDGNEKVTLSVVRCMEPEDAALVNEAVASGTLSLLGEVHKGGYAFYDAECKETYERLREVGKYRKMVVQRDEDGEVMLDGKGDTIKSPTAHTYMQGLFA